MRRCKGCTNGNWAVGRFGAPSPNAEDRNATSEVVVETIITIAEEVGRTNRTGDTMIDGIEIITEEESTETTIEETTIEETITVAMDTEIVDTRTVDTTIDAVTTEIAPVLTSAIPARHLLEISQR